MIIDYISGQTDKFFLKECKTYLNGFKIEQLQKEYKYAKIQMQKGLVKVIF